MLMILAQYILHTILNHLSRCHLGVRLDLCISEIVVPTANSWDDRDPLMTKNELFSPHSLLQRSPLFCFWLSSAAMPVFSGFFLFFFHCCLCIWHFHCLRHRNEFVHWNCSDLKNSPFSCNMIFMISVRSSFHSDSHRFVSFSSAGVFCLVSSNGAAGFTATSVQWSFTRHCCWHRNFQLSTSIFHFKLELIPRVQVNEVNTTQSSGIIKFWFLDSPLLLFFAFWCIRHMFPHFWP